MLDRAHAAANGILRAFAAVGVCRNVAMPPLRLRNDRFHVFERDLAHRFETGGVDVTQRACRVELDPVGPVFHLAAHFSNHRVARVRERRRLGNVDVRIQARIVHVAAGDRERERRNEQARAWNDPAD